MRGGISRPQLNYARFSPSFRFHRTRAEQIGAGITQFPFHPVTLHFPFFFLPFFLNRPDIQFNLPHCASAEGEGDTAHEELTTWEGQREVERGGCQTHKREKLASNKVGRGRRRRPCLAGLITVSGEKEVSKQLSEKRLERSRRKEKLMERTEKRENRIVAGWVRSSLAIHWRCWLVRRSVGRRGSVSYCYVCLRSPFFFRARGATEREGFLFASYTVGSGMQRNYKVE